MAMATRETKEQLAELHQELHARWREDKDNYYKTHDGNCPDFYDYQTWLEIEFESLEEILNS